MPLVPATLGLFAMPELCELAVARKKIAGDHAGNINLSSQWEGVRDVGRHWWLVLRCSILGTGLGAIPGIGSAVIDWIAYGYAQRTEKNPETFGTGDVRGVIAPESSNNAKEGGHLVPTIAFGVPAGASMAILLGAFLMHGLTPGPEMLTKNLDVTYTIVWSLTLAHVIGALICLSGSRWLAQISTVRPEILLPIVLSLVFVAAFEGTHDWGDLYTLMIFGVVGWLMKRLGWPRPPMVLGLVIGGIFERYLYISTSLYGIGWLWRPVVLVILALVAWALFRPFAEIVRSVVARAAPGRPAQAALFRLGGVHVAIIAFIITAICCRRTGRRRRSRCRSPPATWRSSSRASTSSTSCSARSRSRVAGVDGGVATGGHGAAPTTACRTARRCAAAPRSISSGSAASWARRADRVHSGDLRVHPRLHALRLQGAGAALRRSTRSPRRSVLGPVPQAARGGVAAIAPGRPLSRAARVTRLHLTERRK